FVHVPAILSARFRRRVRAVREVRGAEVDGALPPVEHHLPVIDAGRHLVPDWYPGGDERLPDGYSSRVAPVGAQIEQDSYRHSRLPALDDLARIAPVGHE